MATRGESLQFGIIAGYEDCSDQDDLRSDPVFRIVAERNPQDSDLASQPALSRFENSVTPAMLMRLIEFQITTGVERLLQDHGGALPDEVLIPLTMPRIGGRS